MCVAPAYTMRLGEFYPDASTYNPHRYENIDSDKQLPYTYTAFGGGRYMNL